MKRIAIWRLAGILAVAVVLPACGDNPLSPTEQRALTAARANWARRGSLDYTVESRIGCFCPPHMNFWTTLTVRGGHIVAADPLETLPEGFEPSLVGWMTVEGMFEILVAPPDIVQDIDVQFDPQLGYPLRISVSCGPTVADCGSVREMRNLRIP